MTEEIDWDAMKRGVVISPCERFRYSLSRCWRLGPTMLFIGLNPSKADDNYDDPTLRRCISFAHREGCGSLLMTNLFAFRHMNPRVMKMEADPVGPDNVQWLLLAAQAADVRVACWGTDGGHRGQDLLVRTILAGFPLHCFGRNAGGSPKHPLYLPADQGLEPFPFN